MKYLYTLVLLACSMFIGNTQAQNTKVLVGGGLSFATQINTIGLEAKGVYLFTEDWEASAAFTYFFEKDLVKWSMLDFNAHYAFYDDNKFKIYGLAGLNFTFFKIDAPSFGVYFDDSAFTGTDTGFNLGGGGRYAISDRLFIVGEAKYTLRSGGFLKLNAGILYQL